MSLTTAGTGHLVLSSIIWTIDTLHWESLACKL